MTRRVLVRTAYAWYRLESPSREYKTYDDAFRKPEHRNRGGWREAVAESDEDDPSDERNAIHMMPLTGRLARKVFHAKFQVHGDLPPSTMIDDGPDRMRKAASELMKRESERRGGSIKASRETDAYGIAQQIDIAEIGTFRVSRRLMCLSWSDR